MEFQFAYAYRLYLPKEWAEDFGRREKTEVPEEVEFQTKPAIALDQIRAAVDANLDRGVVLADAAYGINTEFRDGLGVKEQTGSCNRALPPFAYARLIGNTSTFRPRGSPRSAPSDIIRTRSQRGAAGALAATS